MAEQETKKSITSVEELLPYLQGEKDSATLIGDPTELNADQKLTRFMSIILLGLVVILLILSISLWDGVKDGKFADLWEYTKLIGTTIIGGIVATYLQPGNGK